MSYNISLNYILKKQDKPAKSDDNEAFKEIRYFNFFI